jgi:hypothetical protein
MALILQKDNLDLAQRVCFLFAYLKDTKDPRFKEVFEIMQDAKEFFEITLPNKTYKASSQTDEDLQDEFGVRAIKVGYLAVVDYTEKKYPELYGIIQRAKTKPIE